MDEIRDSLRREQYEIDSDALACALVERLLVGRSLARATPTRTDP